MLAATLFTMVDTLRRFGTISRRSQCWRVSSFSRALSKFSCSRRRGSRAPVKNHATSPTIHIFGFWSITATAIATAVDAVDATSSLARILPWAVSAHPLHVQLRRPRDCSGSGFRPTSPSSPFRSVVFPVLGDNVLAQLLDEVIDREAAMSDAHVCTEYSQRALSCTL